jgi:hypothetical protein
MYKLFLPESEVRAFRQWTEKLTREEEAKFKNLVARSGEMITRFAKISAPVDTGALRSSINPNFSESGMLYTIDVDKKYAPYMEFGTGKYVRILPGYADIAAQFRGKGIRKVNLHPKPFLFDNFERISKAFIAELKKMGYSEKPV